MKMRGERKKRSIFDITILGTCMVLDGSHGPLYHMVLVQLVNVLDIYDEKKLDFSYFL